jgi:hypothetical protein
LSNIDINGQIILNDDFESEEFNLKYKVKIINQRMLSLSGQFQIHNEKDFIKDVIEKTRNLNIFSGIIEIRNENSFLIMSFNILKGKWDIKKNEYL